MTRSLPTYLWTPPDTCLLFTAKHISARIILAWFRRVVKGVTREDRLLPVFSQDWLDRRSSSNRRRHTRRQHWVESGTTLRKSRSEMKALICILWLPDSGSRSLSLLSGKGIDTNLIQRPCIQRSCLCFVSTSMFKHPRDNAQIQRSFYPQSTNEKVVKLAGAFVNLRIINPVSKNLLTSPSIYQRIFDSSKHSPAILATMRSAIDSSIQPQSFTLTAHSTTLPIQHGHLQFQRLLKRRPAEAVR